LAASASAIKDKIWSNMKEKTKFPADAEDVVKIAIFINMGRLSVSGSPN
jgi:hypothetical protein